MAREFFKISNRNYYLVKNTDDFALNISYLFQRPRCCDMNLYFLG